MKNAGPPVGTSATYRVTVAEEHTAHALGNTGVMVLGTPTLTLFCERAGGMAIAPWLEPKESTVGLHNDIWHLAATPVGREVAITATLAEVMDRHLIFALTGNDGVAEIVRGTHERVVVDLKRFLKRQGL